MNDSHKQRRELHIKQEMFSFRSCSKQTKKTTRNDLGKNIVHLDENDEYDLHRVSQFHIDEFERSFSWLDL